MKKKYIILPVFGVLIVILSFGLGYIYAFVGGEVKEYNMQIKTDSDTLLVHSLVLVRKLKSSDITGLIDATEKNGEYLASFIIENKPLIENSEILEQIEKATNAWEQAKEELRKLRTLKPNNSSNQE